MKIGSVTFSLHDVMQDAVHLAHTHCMHRANLIAFKTVFQTVFADGAPKGYEHLPILLANQQCQSKLIYTVFQKKSCLIFYNNFGKNGPTFHKVV